MGKAAGVNFTANQFNTQFNSQFNTQINAFTTNITKSAAAANQYTKNQTEANAKLKAFGALLGTYLSYRVVKGTAERYAGASSPNGLESVNKSFDILAGTVGSVLMPGFVAAGALALTFADNIKESIDANLPDIINGWVVAIDGAISSVGKFGKWFEDFVNGRSGDPHAGKEGHGLADGWGNRFDLFGQLNALADHEEAGNALWQEIQKGNKRRDALWDKEAGKFIAPPMNPERLAQQNERLGKFRDILGRGAVLDGAPNQGGNVAGAGPGGQWVEIARKAAIAGGAQVDGGFAGKFAKNFEQIIKDMEQSVGRPSITDPSAKWNENQLAMMKSDLEARQMQMWIDGLELLREIAGRLNGGVGRPVGR